MAIRQPIILLIEDDLELRELYEQRLRLEKFDVLLAPDGKTGLEMTENEKPDLIILDIRLPKLDGFGFLQVIKKDEKAKNVPVIVLSALWQDEDKKQALDLGAEQYLVKSEITPKEVVEIISNILNKNKKIDYEKTVGIRRN